MKNFTRFKAIRRIAGIIAFTVVIGLLFAACDNGTTSGGSKIPPPPPLGKSLLAGTFGERYRFSVNKVNARNARAAATDNTTQVEGLLRIGDTVYELKGFYTDEGDFFLSTGSEDEGFEITGNLNSGGAKIKQKGTNEEWTVSEEVITFGDFTVTGEPNVEPAPEFPQAWWGSYDFSEKADANNSRGVEGWMTVIDENENRFFIILGAYGMDFWCNTSFIRQDIEGRNNGWTDEQIDAQVKQLEKSRASFTVLEIEQLNTNTYEVLLLFSLIEDSPYYSSLSDSDSNGPVINFRGDTVREAFRKVKITSAGTGEGSKLTFNLFGKTVHNDEWDYDYFGSYFKTAAEARDADEIDNDGPAGPLVFKKNW
jgi:hypothetical protein